MRADRPYRPNSSLSFAALGAANTTLVRAHVHGAISASSAWAHTCEKRHFRGNVGGTVALSPAAAVQRRRFPPPRRAARPGPRLLCGQKAGGGPLWPQGRNLAELQRLRSAARIAAGSPAPPQACTSSSARTAARMASDAAAGMSPTLGEASCRPCSGARPAQGRRRYAHPASIIIQSCDACQLRLSGVHQLCLVALGLCAKAALAHQPQKQSRNGTVKNVSRIFQNKETSPHMRDRWPK